MAAPDLPRALKLRLATEGVRTHHHYWHFVRRRESWNSLKETDRERFKEARWQAPRFEDEPGAGLDFLFMHREMITMVDKILGEIHDPFWRRVEGWNPIPWSNVDSIWPVPAWENANEDALWAREPTTVTRMRNLVENRFENPIWLKEQSLDQLGTAIEFSIHGWMHLRWSGPQPDDPFSTDTDNDWLFIPWSSHVNKHFWKLHGYIDNRIAAWESATGQLADFSDAWSGPQLPHLERQHPGFHLHSVDSSQMRGLPSILKIPMAARVSEQIIEGIEKGGAVLWGIPR